MASAWRIALTAKPPWSSGKWRVSLGMTLSLTGALLLNGAAWALPATAREGHALAPASSLPLPDFVRLVKSVETGVVSVSSKIMGDDGSRGESGSSGKAPPVHPGPGETPLPGDDQSQPPRNATPVEAMESKGSGFLIGDDGTIVTNYHVIRNATEITVTLSDGTELPARIVGHDSHTDLAVLRVNAGRSLDYIVLGDSAKVQPGQWVVAVGNPYGLGGTVTAGIVSANGRDIGGEPYDNFIQIDAPINRGSSGGPLFTPDGKVIGVNSVILSPSGGSIGIGFAIPADTVRSVVTQILRSGHVTRAYLGISSQTLTPTLAAALGVPVPSTGPVPGALVTSIEAGSPAAVADLRPGDIIEMFDGRAIGDPHDLAVIVANMEPGSRPSVKVWRGGQQVVVTASLTELHRGAIGTPSARALDIPILGLTLQELTPRVEGQVGSIAGGRGVVIAHVQTGSAADLVGLEAGDLLLGVGLSNVDTLATAAQVIQSALGDRDETRAIPLALRIEHGGQVGFVALKPPGKQG